MKHCRVDYEERIQDAAGLIGKDEPVFLLRAKDIVAPDIVLAWSEAARAAGADPVVCDRVRVWADEMLAWQRANAAAIPTTPIHLLRPHPVRPANP